MRLLTGECANIAAVQGTRVLDLSENITGAYAGRLLASAGAAVMVGEPSAGSGLRDAPPFVDTPHGRRSAQWEYLSALKQRRVIDEAGGADWVGIAGEFDAVLLSTDGSAASIAAQARELRRAHPGLVVAAVTPFGLTGPYSTWRAGPLELWAVGGHLALNGEADREPIPGGGPWDSYLVGATAAIATQGALLRARSAAGGSLVDVGAMEALASAHQWSLTMYTHNGVVKRRAGNRHAEMHHPLNLYECSDGWVCVAAATFQQWEGLCVAMDRVELLADDGLISAADRYDRADEVDEQITAWTRAHTSAEVVEACQANFCPAGPVRELTDVLADEQLAARHYWMPAPELGAGVVMPGVPYRLSPGPQLAAAPVVGPIGADRFAPLAGVRVVELTISWAGPLAGRFLADLGADVVKVEHPTSRGVAVTTPDPDAEPEPWAWGELPPATVRNGMYPDAEPGVEWWNRMSVWNKMNRSKRSLCLDIKAPGGREVFEKLVASADIVLNNYSPRGVRSLGIDPETLRAIKPDMVTVSMSGFGAVGPGSEAVSWGPILDAASGLAATTGYADSGPYKQGLAYPDPVGGTHGASAALAAWWEHERTGRAVHVDLSQLETLLAIAGDQIIETAATGHPPIRRGARSATYAPAGVYRCAGDDRWLALTVYDQSDWSRLVALMTDLDRPQWVETGARHSGHDEIDRIITRWTSAHEAHDAMEILQSSGLAATIVATNQDLVEDPQLAARGFMVTVDHHACGPRLYPGSPFLVDGEPLPIRPVYPLGGDNDRVLEELGYTPDGRAALAATDTIAVTPP
ncbi:MAG: CoA transferase [Actinomycetia bacterium]|nr:CoA transferase [Actinomycetes bacterium]